VSGRRPKALVIDLDSGRGAVLECLAGQKDKLSDEFGSQWKAAANDGFFKGREFQLSSAA
jgi:hypothetical protein